MTDAGDPHLMRARTTRMRACASKFLPVAEVMGREDDVNVVLETLGTPCLLAPSRERPLITQRGCCAPSGIHESLPFSEASTRGTRRPRTRNPPIDLAANALQKMAQQC
jgi:hypothetical protein